MAEQLVVCENGIRLTFGIGEEKPVEFSMVPENSPDFPGGGLVEIQVDGIGHTDHHAMKHNVTGLGALLRYQAHTDMRNQWGRRIEMVQQAAGIQITSVLQFYDGIPVVRSWSIVRVTGRESVGIQYVSSFALSGFSQPGEGLWDEKIRVMVPTNSWYGESQWHEGTLPELGLCQVNHNTTRALQCSGRGTWPCSRYLPMGCCLNTQTHTAMAWQIENNGPWSWEIGDRENELYLQLSGPCEDLSHWWKELLPGEEFVSVPCAITVIQGGFEEAIAALTDYRRRIRRPNQDNEKLPVIFNDYMNCLEGDPTTEKELKLIEAAARAGCEYYCIDCGWYSDGEWWDGVGEWLPSAKRFPEGLPYLMEQIRRKGMVPGLWLEIEVVGINSPLAHSLPEDFFFHMHGKRVTDHGRYQLDFRNPKVQAHADGIIRRLVEEYGAGYIKMDYNIDAGIGTDTGADSPGDGLLQHTRAYLDWLDRVFARYPGLVIENCGSGGLRMEYALLSRHSIQSSSDQTDMDKNAAIAAACAAAVCPEQCAVWSYPMRDAGREDVILNMINAMLMRIHQSGHLAELSQDNAELVRLGIEVYRSIRKKIPTAHPFWPLGIPRLGDQWMAYGLHCDDRDYLAVWQIGAGGEKKISVHAASATCLYPGEEPGRIRMEKDGLVISMEGPHMARLLELT